MGDEFSNAADFWAIAARLLERETEKEGCSEESWAIEVIDARTFHMRYYAEGGFAAACILLGDELAAADHHRAIVDAAALLPVLARQASPY